MDQGISGKAKTAAKCHQKKWRLSPDEWETWAKLCAVLQVYCTSDHYLLCSRVNVCCTFQKYQDATLEFSQSKVPTISKVLPLFKMIQQHLEDALKDPNLTKDQSGQKYWGLKCHLKVGLEKMNCHLEKALVGDYPLLSAGECPITCELVLPTCLRQFYTQAFGSHISKTPQGGILRYWPKPKYQTPLWGIQGRWLPFKHCHAQQTIGSGCFHLFWCHTKSNTSTTASSCDINWGQL